MADHDRSERLRHRRRELHLMRSALTAAFLATAAVGFTPGAMATPSGPGYTVYDPLINRLVPTGTIRSVSTSDSAAAIKAQYDLCAPGDGLRFADGTYDQPAIFTSGYNRPGVLIYAENIGAYDSNPFGAMAPGPHHARFTRTVIFEVGSGFNGTPTTVSAADVTIQDITYTTPAGLWPSDGNNWSDLIGGYSASGRDGYILLGSGADRFQLLYCEAWTGYGTAKDPFDPTLGNSYYDYGSATGDRLIEGPVFVQGPSFKGESFTAYGNYLHDMTGGFHNIMPGSGTIWIQHNWGERIYHDFCNMLGQATQPGLPSNIWFKQNIVVDPFGDSNDPSNPHSDLNQVQFQHTNGGAQYYIYGIEMDHNMVFSHETTRGTGIQVNFNPLVSNNNVSTVKPVSRGAKYRENLAVMSGSSHVLDTGVCEHPYIRANVGVHLPGGDTAPSAARFDWLKSNGSATASANKGFHGGNIVENVPSGKIELWNENNYNIGSVGSRLIAETSIFTGDLTAYPTSLAEVFAELKTKGGFVAAGITAADVRAHILGPLDWSNDVPFVGWATAADATPSSTITSEVGWVHGGDGGDTHTITPGAGLEIQILLESDRSTVVQDWTSSPVANVQTNNHVVKARGTSAAADGAVQFTYDVDGNGYTWDVISQYNPYAQAAFSAASAVSQPSNASIGSDGSTITIGFELSINADVASAKDMFNTVSGVGTFRIQVLSDETLRCYFYNAAGTEICRFVTGQSLPTDGKPKRFLMTVDMSQATGAEAVKVYVDGVPDSTVNVQAFTSGQNIGFSRSVRRRLGGIEAFDLGFVFVTSTLVDLSDPLERAKFNASNIGSDGSGVTGAQPPIFMWGDVAKLNSADANYGSVTFAQSGTDVT